MDYVEERPVKPLCKCHFCFLISATSCEHPFHWEPSRDTIDAKSSIFGSGPAVEREKNDQHALFGKVSMAQDGL